MTAAVITYDMAGTELALGLLRRRAPALLVFWIRRSVKEPEKWHQAREQASLGKELGSIAELFRDPVLRRNTIAGAPDGGGGAGRALGRRLLERGSPAAGPQAVQPAGPDLDRTKSVMFFIQQLGAMLGIYAFAVSARRRTGAPLRPLVCPRLDLHPDVLLGCGQATAANVPAFLGRRPDAHHFLRRVPG